ncbi:MAG TPA: aminopeptidase P family N-terminal domain-containing protein, partial [Terriglobales bacterium]|nr:aminopeptidase P family N-terminal domain-containing protein [Terriglobales bacterium]
MSTSKFSIPRTEFMNRLKFTRAELRELGFDALLAVSGYAERDGNVCYLCGHKNAFPYSNAGNIISGLGFSALLVPTESQNPTILVAPLGYQSDVVTGVDQAKTGTNLADELVAAIKESGLESAKIALAGSDIIPVAYLDKVKSTCPSLKIDYQDGLVSNQRMIKSENELRLIRFASKIADKALGLTIDSVKPGMTESEIGTIARRTAMELGADYVVRDRVQSG